MNHQVTSQRRTGPGSAGLTMSPTAPGPTTPHPSATPRPATLQPPVAEAQASGRRTRASAPATCGELGQGWIDGQDFLVNCPIDLHARATVRSGGLSVEGPGALTKVVAAIERMSSQFGFVADERVTVHSPIPRGKGMASSTADISAALMALSQHRGIEISQADFARLITSIEPSDCVHVTGIAEVNHLSGQILNNWPAPRGMRVIVLDCGGSVDTVSFDRARARALYAEARQDVLRFRALLRYGLTLGDAEAIGHGATLSARLSQRILPKPELDEVIRVALAHGAWGVNCAHSGTVLGVLHHDSERMTEALLNAIDRVLGHDVSVLGDYRIVSGGCQHAI